MGLDEPRPEPDAQCIDQRHHDVDRQDSGALGVNLFGGRRATEFGQFEGNSNLYLVVRYAF